MKKEEVELEIRQESAPMVEKMCHAMTLLHSLHLELEKAWFEQDRAPIVPFCHSESARLFHPETRKFLREFEFKGKEEQLLDDICSVTEKLNFAREELLALYKKRRQFGSKKGYKMVEVPW